MPKSYVPLVIHKGEICERETKFNLITNRYETYYTPRNPRSVTIGGVEYWDAGRGLKRLRIIGEDDER